MSDARKCNKCHKCFDPLEQEGRMARFVNPIFQTSNEIQEYVRGQLLYEEMGPDGIVDLCPECSVKFRKFMLGKENDDSLKDTIDDLLDKIMDAPKKRKRIIDAHMHKFPSPGGDYDGD